MAQHDYNIANQTGSAFRADLNNALSAILSSNSGGSEPSTKTAYMFWADTNNNILKLRNSANNGWISLRTLTGNITVTPLGVGTDSPSSYSADANTLVVYEEGSNSGITLATNSSSYKTSIYFADGTSSGNYDVGRIEYDHSVNFMDFWVNGSMRQSFGQGGTLHILANANPIVAQSSEAAGTTYFFLEGRYGATAGTRSSGTRSAVIYTNGNIENTNNSYGQISDSKLKENIADASAQWDDIKSIELKNFNFIGQSTRQLGVIAQQVETVSPGLVYENEELDGENTPTGVKTKGVKYSVLYLKAVKALQEAMARIEQLEAKVAALESA